MSTSILGGHTRILTLLADPVAQARSPRLVNELLAKRGQLGAYVLVPLAVPSAGLASVVAGLRSVTNFCGSIVSMPHKRAILPLLDGLSAEATLTGAVNVIRREPDGRLVGTCLDGEGMVAGLRASGHAIAGRSCLLLGAGGAASAIAMAMARHGCASLCIENRTVGRAVELASAVRRAFPECVVHVGVLPGAAFDIAINATSLGMSAQDPLPLSLDMLARTTLVAECVVTREITPLLQVAQERGRQIQIGLAMLEAQVALLLQFMGVAA